MSQRTVGTAVRKRRKQYHHGDLRRSLVAEAARTIQVRGVEHLTLREVGHSLGVSRTALYRHFADKAGLLAAVATEGFAQLRQDLVDAWEQHGRGRAGFEAMGIAYVRFAMKSPPYYRVMFGGLVEADPSDCALQAQAGGAFEVLGAAIVEQQNAGLVRADDPVQLARYIWAAVHGIAMLGIDGQLRDAEGGADALIHFANQRLREGIATDARLATS